MKELKIEKVKILFQEHNVLKTREDLLNIYWTYHPRFKFFKSIKQNAEFLDVGAGNGGLIYWQEWGMPKRYDIKMHAIDLFKGDLFDKYESFNIANLDNEDIKYENGCFDAILMSHVIEHIKNERKIFKELNRVLKVGGKLYLEMPAPVTLNLPKCTAFQEKGFNVSVINFYDDHTHIRTFELKDIEQIVSEHGFKTLESGVIKNEYLEDELINYGLKNNDNEITTYAIWSKLRWSQYLVLEKVE